MEQGYYAPLEHTEEMIISYNNQDFNGTASELVGLGIGFEFANDSPSTKPDLVHAQPFEINIAGNVTGGGAFGGSHPPIPTRPR